MSHTPNQLRPDFLSVNALNTFPGTVSASRAQMFGSHLSQKLVVSGLQQRYLLTGMEKEFGKYTFSVKMPTNGRILKVAERYRRTIGIDSIETNPQTVVIYEDEETGMVGMLDIPQFCSYHQYFGFAYKPVEKAIHKLVPGRSIAEGEIFMDSPAIGPNGEYMFGVNMNLAYFTHPAVSEDGIMISSDVLDRFKFKTYERRVVQWGSKTFPLNTYGTHSFFKGFPDIGEKVRDDGILMMFRSYDPLMAPVEQSIYDLCEPDYNFDEGIYVAPGGKIVDILVHHDYGTSVNTPEGMDTQANKYHKASRSFYTEILAEWRRLHKVRGASLVLTPELHRLIVEAQIATDDGGESKIQKLHRAAPLDDYRIEFVIEYEITPTTGFKLTDCAGGKAVVCKIVPPEMMPVDSDGNRADMVMDPFSTISRANYSRLYEQYFNAASRDVLKNLRKVTGIQKEERHPHVRVIEMQQNTPALFEQAYNYLTGYYKIISPKQYKRFTEDATLEEKVNHLGEVLKDFVYLYTPTDNEPELMDMLDQVEESYRPLYGPVSYIGSSGRRVTTKDPVRIGSVYIMLLEKIGDDWSAVSSGRLHHFGFLAPVSRADKHSQPVRMQPVRAFGESETRIIVSYCGQRAMAEIMDRNGSPETHKEICFSILRSDRPTNIAVAVDRKKIPFGGSKPIQLVDHVAYCAGWKIVYKSTK